MSNTAAPAVLAPRQAPGGEVERQVVQHTHQLCNTIIPDGAEKTRFLTNISWVEEGVSFTADGSLLAKHYRGDSRHEHIQVQHSYRRFALSHLLKHVAVKKRDDVSVIFPDPLYPAGSSVWKKPE